MKRIGRNAAWRHKARSANTTFVGRNRTLSGDDPERYALARTRSLQGSRLPHALVSERLADRYISDHGILLGQCGVAVGAAMITSEAGEQKSDCVGMEEHPCGD